MKLKKKIIRKHVVIISFIFLITILLLNNPYIYSKSNSINSDETNLKNLKKSNSWEFNYIHIDDNWTLTLAQPWCNLVNGKYVIENVTIDASTSPTGSGIFINNSKMEYFIIRNVTVYNSGSTGSNAGIKLENTNNGTLINNSCSLNSNGIHLISSNYNNVSGNTVNDNYIGIYLDSSYNNTVSGNTAFNNNRGGVNLLSSNYNNVSGNNLSNNWEGINLQSSNYNNVSGNTANINSGHGIHLWSSNYNNFSGNTANNNRGDGIFLSSSNNNTISGNNANNNYDNGITIRNSNNNTLSGNNMTQCGIIIEGSSLEAYSSHKITTTNLVNEKLVYYYVNEIGLGKDNFSNVGQVILVNCNKSKVSNLNISDTSIGILLSYSNNNTVSGNNVSKNNRYGIRLFCSSNNNLSGNTANNNEWYGIYLSSSHNNTISGNNASTNKEDGDGIILSFSNNNTILGNTANNNSYAGISLLSSNNNTISGNNASNNDRGIYLSSSHNNTISGNNASNNDYVGIRLTYSYNNTISGNNVVNNNITGISLDGSNYNNISRNNASDNGTNNQYIGIYFDYCHNNKISGNDASNNKYYGILLWTVCNDNIFSGNIVNNNSGCGVNISNSDSQNNIFFNNYFTDNGISAIDNGNNNQWDNGVIGNYWDDYTGYDLNGDGIGDTPYNISGLAKSVDRFPQIIKMPPQIIIENPHTNELFGYYPPEIDLTIISPNIDTIWYILSNETNTTNNYKFTGEIEQNIWNSMGNGTLAIEFYANNSYGLIGSSEVIVRKDIISPQILIYNPIENQEFTINAPFYNITVLEPNLESIWYTIDNGNTNFTITGLTGNISQSAWESAPNGAITIYFYARDKAGNIGENYIIIIKDAPPEQKPKIAGYHIFLLIGASSLVMVLLAKKKYIK